MKYISYFIVIFSVVLAYTFISKNKDNDLDSLSSTSEYTVDWLTDYSAAKAKAEIEGKPILINFTGSDWCAACIRLNKEIFSKPVFMKFANEHLILLKIDFPFGVQQEESLINQNNFLYDYFEIEGLPTVILLNSEVEIHREYGYRRDDLHAYVGRLKRLLFIVD